MRAFWIFLVGSLIAAGAVSYGLYRVGLDPVWIVIAALLIVGVAVASGASLARKRPETNVSVNASNDDPPQ